MVIPASASACAGCGTPLDAGTCWRCRASIAEARLQQLSVWGDDDWVRKLAQSEMVGIDGKPRSGRALHPLGFSAKLDATGSGTRLSLVARPQIPFKPVLLTIPPECARGTLVDFQIGNRSQFVSSAPIPLSLFNPKNWDSIEVMWQAMGRFGMDVANVAVGITLYVDLAPLPTDPLVQVAYAQQGIPTPTHFHAALWGYTEWEEEPRSLSPSFSPMMLPASEDFARTLALQAVAQTPEFPRIVKQIQRRLKKKG